MDYSIGEVSALLNLSRDMIRYYEKHGAIHACRKENNNYRTYDSMEVFWLLEAMQHKSWGIPISEIEGIRGNTYTISTSSFLRAEAAKMADEISYKTLLRQRLDQLSSNLRLSMKNLGNYWVEEIPAVYRCHLVAGKEDVYDQINLSQEQSRFIFSDRMLPFFDAALTHCADHIDWEMSIQEDYVQQLGVTVPEGFYRIPAGPCLCTNADIGEIGQFNTDAFRGLCEYLGTHNYTVPDGAPIRGIILGRGFENSTFHRIVKIFHPVL